MNRGKNYKIQITKYKQIPNYNVQNYKQPYRVTGLAPFLTLEPFLAQYPELKYSYLLEIKYIKPQDKKKELTPGKIQKIKEEAEAQLNRYCRDEKFKKAIGQTTLKKLVLIFCGTRLENHSEI